MTIRVLTNLVIALVVMLITTGSGNAAVPDSTAMESGMSAVLDIWREGRYEQLFDHLANRGKTSRETFVKKMRESTTRPACCWQKMENFRVLKEKRTEATVYVKLGLEGAPGTAKSATREFKLTHMDGVWKMQMSDILSIAGVTGKKKSKKSVVKYSTHYSN